MEKYFNYSIHLKNEGTNRETIVLKQISESNTINNILEFPKSDIDMVIETLFKSKKDIFDEEIDLPNEQEINPMILDTFVELFFSGIRNFKVLPSMQTNPVQRHRSRADHHPRAARHRHRHPPGRDDLCRGRKRIGQDHVDLDHVRHPVADRG